MNRFTQPLLFVSVQVTIALTILGFAATALATGQPCNVATNVACSGNGPNACKFVFQPTFACCNTYGSVCCTRQCGTVACEANPDVPGAVCAVDGNSVAASAGQSISGICAASGRCLAEQDPIDPNPS